MRKTICCIITLALALVSLAGCNDPNGYRVYKEDGRYYLSLGALYEKYRRGEDAPLVSSAVGSAYIYFDSAREMYRDIWSGNFTDAEFRKLAILQGRTEGVIPLPDLDNLYVPSLSGDWETSASGSAYQILWYCAQYSYLYEIETPYACNLQILPMGKESYKRLLESFNDPDTYTYEKKVAPSITQEYTVFSKVDSSGNMSIYVLGAYNGMYFEAIIRNIEQCPSDEMIAGIGMVPFVK